jgi:hypothetical protein
MAGDDPWAKYQDAPASKGDSGSSDPWSKYPDADATSQKGLWDKVKGALRYGAAQDAAGMANTLGETGVLPGVQGGLNTAAHAASGTDPGAPVQDPSYTPASEGLHDTRRSLLDRAGYIPRAIVNRRRTLTPDRRPKFL